MITNVTWQGWQYTGKVTKDIENILKSTPTIDDKDYSIECSFGFGPMGGRCSLDKNDVGLAKIIDKAELKPMLEKIIDAILDMDKGYASGKMFKHTSLSDVKILTDTGAILIDLKY